MHCVSVNSAVKRGGFICNLSFWYVQIHLTIDFLVTKILHIRWSNSLWHCCPMHCLPTECAVADKRRFTFSRYNIRLLYKMHLDNLLSSVLFNTIDKLWTIQVIVGKTMAGTVLNWRNILYISFCNYEWISILEQLDDVSDYHLEQDFLFWASIHVSSSS